MNLKFVDVFLHPGGSFVDLWGVIFRPGVWPVANASAVDMAVEMVMLVAMLNVDGHGRGHWDWATGMVALPSWHCHGDGLPDPLPLHCAGRLARSPDSNAPRGIPWGTPLRKGNPLGESSWGFHGPWDSP